MDHNFQLLIYIILLLHLFYGAYAGVLGWLVFNSVAGPFIG